MRRQGACQICARLGRTQCGYHQFKKNFSISKEKTIGQQNNFAQTQSSIRHQQLVQSKYTRNLTPTKATSVNINFNYPQTQSPLRNQQASNVVYNNSRALFTPQKTQEMHYLPQVERPQIIQARQPNHLIRVEGGQVLYYPIYPVYQVVYQAVQSSPLSHSGLIY